MEVKIRRVLKEAEGQWGIYAGYLDTAEVIYKLEADKKFYAASINKVAIALAVMKLVESDQAKLSDRLKLTPAQKMPGTGVLNLLEDGLKLSIKDALALMLAQSDNTAAKMLVSHFGISNINNSLRDTGLKITYLREVGKNRFHFGDTTPAEAAVILANLYTAQFISSAHAKLVLDAMKECHLNWGIERYLPTSGLAKTEVSNKEGTWEDMRHEVAVVWAHRPYSLCIFSSQLVDQRRHVDNNGVLAIAEISKIIYETIT